MARDASMYAVLSAAAVGTVTLGCRNGPSSSAAAKSIVPYDVRLDSERLTSLPLPSKETHLVWHASSVVL